MTEYTIGTVIILIPMIVIFYLMMAAMRRYLVPIYFFIGLPIP